jgi:hypothetical protein
MSTVGIVLIVWAGVLALFVAALVLATRRRRAAVVPDPLSEAERRTRRGDRRAGQPDRRRGLPDPRTHRIERRSGRLDRRTGLPDRRQAVDRLAL